MINWKDFIVSDKSILMGKPTVKGTRLSVEHLINLYAQGWNEEIILTNYPSLNREKLLAVFLYIGECMKDGLIYELPKSA